MKKTMFQRTFKFIRSGAAAFLLIAFTLTVAACGNGSSNSQASQITIATKGFAESDIMQQALKLMVENDTKLKVETVKLDNNLLWEAVKKGDVDLYVEYTGTALINILKQPPEFDPQAVYDKVKKQLQEKENLTMLDPLGFNNTYALAVRRDVAEKYGLKTISDLARHAGELVLAADPLIESDKRPDGYVQAKNAYGLKFKELKGISDRSMQVKAVTNKEADALVVFSTDGSIAANDFIVLQDDKHVFVPYYAAPLVRSKTLEEHPELKQALNKLSGKITADAMQKLNNQVESEKKKPADVAKTWLKEKGLINSNK